MLVLIACFFAATAYARGVRALWRRAGYGRSVTRTQAAFFYLGLLAVVAALETPLDPLAHALFSAHMVQHLLLIVVAAPLLVLGTPLLVLAWALPDLSRSRLGALFRAGRTPIAIAFGLHSVALWLWHFPRLYDAALADPVVHGLEHLSFVGTATLFWWAVLRKGHAAAGVLFVFGLALESTILGALLTFAGRPWYASHLSTTAAFGLTPLEDQQLAGLIMWIPGGLVYLASALALFSRLFVTSPDPEPHPPAQR